MASVGSMSEKMSPMAERGDDEWMRMSSQINVGLRQCFVNSRD